MKITQAELKKKFNKGWQVDKVDKPKPKPKPKKMLKEAVAESINKSSGETAKAIATMAKILTKVFEDQNSNLIDKLNQISDKEVVVNLPKPATVKTVKKNHKFTVKRDHRGFIEEIIAEEI